LGKGHRQILIPTREASRPRISVVSSDTTPKLAIRQEAQQLREDSSALIHASLWITRIVDHPDSVIEGPATFSNRGKPNARSTLSKKSTCRPTVLH